jgi:hypothetical protein
MEIRIIPCIDIMYLRIHPKSIFIINNKELKVKYILCYKW